MATRLRLPQGDAAVAICAQPPRRSRVPGGRQGRLPERSARGLRGQGEPSCAPPHRRGRADQSRATPAQLVDTETRPLVRPGPAARVPQRAAPPRQTPCNAPAPPDRRAAPRPCNAHGPAPARPRKHLGLCVLKVSAALGRSHWSAGKLATAAATSSSVGSTGGLRYWNRPNTLPGRGSPAFTTPALPRCA